MGIRVISALILIKIFEPHLFYLAPAPVCIPPLPKGHARGVAAGRAYVKLYV